MQRNLFTLAFFGLFVCFVSANPAIEAQRQFNRVVDSNQCLKECMVPVQASNMELSVFKQANYSNYFLKLDQICDLITDARHCIDNCQIKSNPFALISMNIVCSERSRQDAKLLEQCFANVGAQVSTQCAQICGDHEQLSEQLHLSTSTLKPEDQSSLETINKKTNEACSVLKCSARCSVDQYNRQCGHLINGQKAGDLLRELVDNVLKSHQMDLKVFGVLETLQKNSQPECNYIHAAGVLFDPIKDLASQQAPQQTEVAQQAIPEQARNVANQLYVRILKKQLQVLNKQLEIMDRQEHKMDADNEMPRFVQPMPVDF